ncbi:MAG: hypothetical protein AAF614_36525 [Chloroflexota bacterium]
MKKNKQFKVKTRLAAGCNSADKAELDKLLKSAMEDFEGLSSAYILDLEEARDFAPSTGCGRVKFMVG